MKKSTVQKNKMTMHALVARMCTMLLVLFAISVFAGCDGMLAPAGTGNIVITVAQDMQGAKTLVPTLDMTVADYVITGSGPAGSSLPATTVSAANPSAIVSGLPIGAWTITATARNAAQTAIGQGSKTVTIAPGANTAVAITVSPLSGTGDLSINLAWPAASIASPNVVASITPIGGSSQIVPSTSTVNASAGTASLAWNGVQSGYYTMSIRLQDDTTDKAGVSEVVRILKNQTTSGSYTWTTVN